MMLWEKDQKLHQLTKKEVGREMSHLPELSSCWESEVSENVHLKSSFFLSVSSWLSHLLNILVDTNQGLGIMVCDIWNLC